MKTVLVACGTAVATSTVVASAIEEAAKAEGIKVDTRQCKVAEIGAYAKDADLIVSTTQVAQDYGIPVINGLPFLTGIGKEQTLQEIISTLKN